MTSPLEQNLGPPKATPELEARAKQNVDWLDDKPSLRPVPTKRKSYHPPYHGERWCRPEQDPQEQKKRTGLADTPASGSPTIHVFTPILRLVDEQAERSTP